jgi:hypothetical protein
VCDAQLWEIRDERVGLDLAQRATVVRAHLFFTMIDLVLLVLSEFATRRETLCLLCFDVHVPFLIHLNPVPAHGNTLLPST